MTAGGVQMLLDGAWVTIWISLVAIALGVPLGLVLSLIRVARVPVLSRIVVLYVSVGRATPLVTLVLFLFVTLPVFGVNIDKYTAGVVALTLNTASFNTEVWRSVYQAFPQPQIEAARAMGMTRALYFRRIMLPQMWYAALPALVNEMTLLIKASPAIAVVGVVDLTRVTSRIAAQTYEPLPPILVAGAMYILFIGLLVRLQRHLERRRERYAA
ncbi:MAG: amino acid ABC transporter permease [Thiotrichales bacterium]|nr:amino acid ABC transporter permease [Thiotrichales bacterium]